MGVNPVKPRPILLGQAFAHSPGERHLSGQAARLQKLSSLSARRRLPRDADVTQ
jgi:hypothetical protein